MKLFSLLIILVFILACKSENSDLNSPNNCLGCASTDTTERIYIVNAIADTVWLTQYDTGIYERSSMDFGVCSSLVDLSSLNNEMIIKAEVVEYEDCAIDNYVDILKVQRIETCHSTYDTISGSFPLINTWRILGFENRMISCELEPSFLQVSQPNDVLELSALLWSSKAQLLEDTLILYDHSISLEVFSNPDANDFSNSLNDFFGPNSTSDTIKVTYSIADNILQISNQVLDQKLILHTN